MSQWGVSDFAITYSIHEKEDLISSEMISEISQLDGIDFSDPAKLETYQQNFFGGVFGIDSAYLEEINKTLNLPVDTSAFEQGKVVLLSKTVEGLIQPGQEITIQTQNGQHSFVVANVFLDDGFRVGAAMSVGRLLICISAKRLCKSFSHSIEYSGLPLILMGNRTKIYCKN